MAAKKSTAAASKPSTDISWTKKSIAIVIAAVALGLIFFCFGSAVCASDDRFRRCRSNAWHSVRSVRSRFGCATREQALRNVPRVFPVLLDGTLGRHVQTAARDWHHNFDTVSLRLAHDSAVSPHRHAFYIVFFFFFFLVFLVTLLALQLSASGLCCASCLRLCQSESVLRRAAHCGLLPPQWWRRGHRDGDHLFWHESRLSRPLLLSGAVGGLLVRVDWYALLVGFGACLLTPARRAGHFFFEHNRPATFLYPSYSLASDYMMLFSLATGRIAMN